MRKIIIYFLLSLLASCEGDVVFGQTGTCDDSISSCLSALQIRCQYTMNGDDNGALGCDTAVVATERWVDSLIASGGASDTAALRSVAIVGGITVTTCDSYLWNGTLYTSSGTKTFGSGKTKLCADATLGCQSVDTLYLTIKSSSSSTASVVATSSYTWNGSTYTSSGTYQYSCSSCNSVGCDSTATLYLSILTDSGTVTSIATVSPITGGTITSSGTIGLNKTGIDSVGTLILGSIGNGFTSIDTSHTNAVSAIASGTGISVSVGGKKVTITNTSPSSGGTVTNITTQSPITGGTITTTGNLKLDKTAIDSLGTIILGTWHGTKVGLAYGGTNADLSATGGTSQVLQQTSSGAAITVGQLAATNLSDYVTITNWTDTTHISGWTNSSLTANQIWYSRLGNLLYMFWNISGTSNATTKSITLPYTIATTNASTNLQGQARCSNNGGALVMSFAFCASNTSTLNILSAPASGSTWTASGTAAASGWIILILP